MGARHFDSSQSIMYDNTITKTQRAIDANSLLKPDILRLTVHSACCNWVSSHIPSL